MDNGQLNQIKLSGYKSIREIDLTLTNLNVLIGPNGSGKSNFINFFKFMNKVLLKDLQLYVAQSGGAESFLYFGSKVTKEINIYLHFSPNSYQLTLVPTQDGRLIFKEESATFHRDESHRYKDSLAPAGAEESSLPRLYENSGEKKRLLYVAEYISSWKVYHFHDTSDTSALKKVCNVNDNQYFAQQGDNIAAFLLSLQQKPEYQNIVQVIQRVAPFFQDFILQPEKNSPDNIRLRWKHKGSDAYFDANNLSDGTLRFICLATLLLQPDMPKAIILDEPELGLHPFALQLLAGMLKSASKRTQIILSTQSVTLANQFDYKDIIIVDRIEHDSRFRRLEEQEVSAWIEDYKIGDIWEKNLIGGTP